MPDGQGAGRGHPYPQRPRTPGAGAAYPSPGGPGGQLRGREGVVQGFLQQRARGPAAAAGPRTRPSAYPDVRGFASTPMGQLLLRNIMQRMMAGQGAAQPRPRG